MKKNNDGVSEHQYIYEPIKAHLVPLQLMAYNMATEDTTIRNILNKMPDADLTMSNISVQMLPIEHLVIDRNGQRPIIKAEIKQMLESGFKPEMFGSVIAVEITPTQYAVADGQQRATFATMCGVRYVPAVVVRCDGTYEDRIKLTREIFMRTNIITRKVSASSRLVVNSNMGAQEEREFIDFTSTLGIEIGHNSKVSTITSVLNQISKEDFTIAYRIFRSVFDASLDDNKVPAFFKAFSFWLYLWKNWIGHKPEVIAEYLREICSDGGDPKVSIFMRKIANSSGSKTDRNHFVYHSEKFNEFLSRQRTYRLRLPIYPYERLDNMQRRFYREPLPKIPDNTTTGWKKYFNEY